MTTPEEMCAVFCGEGDHRTGCPVGKALRDTYCTPAWLTRVLPVFGLDPCSNPRSTVMAEQHLSLENGDDGLRTSWKGRSVFVNPPFSCITPWAEKAREAESFIFLVPLAPSTKWWRKLIAAGGFAQFQFSRRLNFNPPPRIKKTSNPKESVMIMTMEAKKSCPEELEDFGHWWLLH